MAAFLQIVAVVLLVGLCLWIIAPFVTLVIWAVIIAVAVFPAHQKLSPALGGREKLSAALLVLAGQGESGILPAWVGQLSAALAFLLVGAGIHTVQTAGLALATDLTPPESHPKVVGLMYVMLLLGMVVSALVFGALLETYTPGRLIQVIQGAALLTMALNLTALWKQESRDRSRSAAPPAAPPGTPRSRSSASPSRSRVFTS